MNALHLDLITLRVSSVSHVLCFLFFLMMILGMHWSAAANSRSLKLDQASSIDLFKKQQFHAILLRDFCKKSKVSFLKVVDSHRLTMGMSKQVGNAKVHDTVITTF